MTHTTILRTIILLAGTITTNHPISMFIGMIASDIMTFVAGKNFIAARKPEPTIGFRIVTTAPTIR